MRLSPRMRLVLVAAALLGTAAGVGLWLYQERQEDKFRAHAVKRGVLYRSPQPGPEQLAGLRRRNIRTVVNLRPAKQGPAAFAEEQRTCQALGLEFVNLPIWSILPSDAQIEQFLRLVRRPDRGAVLVHCEYGRARTGAMVAAYRVLVEGVAVDSALGEMLGHWRECTQAERDAVMELLQRLQRDRQEWLARTAPAL